MFNIFKSGKYEKNYANYSAFCLFHISHLWMEGMGCNMLHSQSSATSNTSPLHQLSQVNYETV